MTGYIETPESAVQAMEAARSALWQGYGDLLAAGRKAEAMKLFHAYNAIQEAIDEHSEPDPDAEYTARAQANLVDSYTTGWGG